MPLHIVKREELDNGAEQIVSLTDIDLEKVTDHNYAPLVEAYGRVLSKAILEGKQGLAVSFPENVPTNLTSGKLKELTVKAVRAFLEKCEDVLLVLLVDGDGRDRITAGWFPDLERSLARRRPPLAASSLFLDYSHNHKESAKYVNSSDIYDQKEGCDLEESICCCYKEALIEEEGLEDLLKNRSLTFSQLLLKMLDERAITEVEFYKRANMDRKLFSKMRNPDYQPSRNTVLAAIVGLRLNVEEAEQLMAAAGYGWSKSNKTDIIVRYYLKNCIFDIDRLNLSLYDHGEKTLGTRIS